MESVAIELDNVADVAFDQVIVTAATPHLHQFNSNSTFNSIQMMAENVEYYLHSDGNVVADVGGVIVAVGEIQMAQIRRTDDSRSSSIAGSGGCGGCGGCFFRPEIGIGWSVAVRRQIRILQQPIDDRFDTRLPFTPFFEYLKRIEIKI